MKSLFEESNDKNELVELFNSRVTQPELVTSLNEIMLHSLVPVSFGLGALYILLGFFHYFLLPQSIAYALSLSAFLSAIILLAIGLIIRIREIQLGSVNIIGASIAGLVLINSFLHLYLTSDPKQTTNLMLFVVGVGFFFLSHYWFSLTLVVSCLGWGLLVWTIGSPLDWVHFAFGLLMAVVLSILIHIVRVRTIVRLEVLKLQDEEIKQNLEVALVQTKESEDRFRALVQNIPDYVLMVDQDGKILFINKPFLGFTDEEILGQTIYNFMTSESFNLVKETLKRVFNNGDISTFENTGVSSDNSIHWYRTRVGPILFGNKVISAILIGTEITEQKILEEAVKISEAKLRAVLDTTVNGIITIDDMGLIETYNNSAAKIFGFAPGEVIGKNINVLMPEPHHSQHDGYINKYKETGTSRIIGIVRQVEGKRKDGTIFPMELSVSEVILSNNRWFTGVIKDISEQVEAEGIRTKLENDLREAYEKIQFELELAAEIQTSLLPSALPTYSGFDFDTSFKPARDLSGDIFDFISLDNGNCFINLADIAGKGVPASLLTFTARSLLRSEILHKKSPRKILSNINSSIYDDLTQSEMFLTVFTGKLDTRLGTLTYANAGHTEIIWWKYIDKKCVNLPATGLPIGILANITIEEETITLRPGDVLIFYSDGITEADNRQGDLFGIERLMKALVDHYHRSASDICHAIMNAVDEFRNGLTLSDDITLIVLKILPRVISFNYHATLNHLNEMSLIIRESTRPYGEELAYQMELASSEIITNVIKHAYAQITGEIRGEISLMYDKIQLDIYDNGLPFDFKSSVQEINLGELKESGFGLSIVNQLTDELLYSPSTSEGNHWRLVKIVESHSNGS